MDEWSTSADLNDFSFRATPELAPDQRWSAWPDLERLCKGPEPRPAWVVTEAAAIDTELGILKTGKEADCFLLERAVPGDPSDPASPPTRSTLMVAKRYRDLEHRTFRRADSYTEGRTVRRSRDVRALNRKSHYGRQVQQGQWAVAEWAALTQLWSLGAPVPYPIQIDGTEICMEYLTDGDQTAPRLAGLRPTPDELATLYDQLVTALELITEVGLVHGDLSPYNVLVSNGRLMIIDLPQMIDLRANPNGTDFLHRDCVNMCTWFARRGLDVDPDELTARLVALAW